MILTSFREKAQCPFVKLEDVRIHHLEDSFHVRTVLENSLVLLQERYLLSYLLIGIK
jgi:hypothetical protein